MKYRKLMKSLTIESEEYYQLKRAFQGGFTHANSVHVNQKLTNVYSMDFTSSYPYVLLSEKFPMGKARRVSKIKSDEHLNSLLDKYCCIFDLELFNVRPKLSQENYISQSRCLHLENGVINNGRVYSADYLVTTVTEQDFAIIKDLYYVDRYIVRNMRVYSKGYLPKNFIIAMLNLYEAKTKLKGVKGKEVEYMNAKEQLNSMYGMCVTDICRSEIVYSDTWNKKLPDFDDAIKKNNKSLKRFLFYPWGVWVTAYARRNLFSAIKALGNDYVYSDTDSVKYLRHYEHSDYFENYNIQVNEKLLCISKERNIPFDKMSPLTINNEKKTIGMWDYEGYYDYFKTLGAKRYMTFKDDKLSLTVSGLNKNITIPYLLSFFNNDINEIFENFDIGFEVPAEYTGKLTHTYIDEEYSTFVRDYQGNICYVEEKSFVHLEPASYSMDISEVFLKFLKGVREENV